MGLKWSERWLRDGHGEWCYGKVTFVFKKKPRMPQKYRIKYHEGTVMESLEADIERAPEDETSSDEREARPDQVELGLDDREEDGEEGLWEFVFISKFRRESWLWLGRNFAISILSQRPVLYACVMPYLCLNSMKYPP